MIYNPLEEYNSKFKSLHNQNTADFFEDLVEKSGVDIEANRQTVKEYSEIQTSLEKLNKKLRWRKFWRVLMILTIILIVVVILKLNPKIKSLKEEIESADKKADELLSLAKSQVAPLISLFSATDSLRLIEKTIENIKFEPCFTEKQERDMRLNYDFSPATSLEESTLEVLAGHYNENPFVFENKLVHTMGVETYHGYKRITWTETYRDSEGKLRTRTRSETLHATLTKPKPFYSTKVVLNYGAQGGANLCFSRDAGDLDEKSKAQLERHIKRGERKLKRKTDNAIKGDGSFMSMSNSEFEVLFDALDRTNEVEFRTLFTPLAQTNLAQLITTPDPYGDDFEFIKNRRMNLISTKHSQGRNIVLNPKSFESHSFDVVKTQFLNENAEFFKAVYFDFAPLFAIPIYQERPVHSLKPIPPCEQMYSDRQCETLANAMNRSRVVHPNTKTNAILKTSFSGMGIGGQKTTVSAYSYDIEPRVDYVRVHGGDGRWHNVAVNWDEYLPLEHETEFCVCDAKNGGRTALAVKNGLCIFN